MAENYFDRPDGVDVPIVRRSFSLSVPGNCASYFAGGAVSSAGGAVSSAGGAVSSAGGAVSSAAGAVSSAAGAFSSAIGAFSSVAFSSAKAIPEKPTRSMNVSRLSNTKDRESWRKYCMSLSPLIRGDFSLGPLRLRNVRYNIINCGCREVGNSKRLPRSRGDSLFHSPFCLPNGTPSE